MSNPVGGSSGVRVYPLMGHNDTFSISPTSAEQRQIAAARAHRAKVGHGYQQAANSRHRLVGFDYAKASLKPAHMQYIKHSVLKEARLFGTRPKFVIRGHASRSGSARGNFALSHRRALVVADYIRKLVPNAHVVIETTGESEPHKAGARDGSEDFMDRAVEIGVMKSGVKKAGHQDWATLIIEQQKFMRSTFERFAREAGLVSLLKAINFPTLQSLLQSTSKHNRRIINNGYLQHILHKSWPIIHKRYPQISVQQVVDNLKAWHQDLKR